MNQKTYEEAEVQVGENDINDEIARQMRDLGIKNDEQKREIIKLETKICEHESSIFRLDEKNLKQLTEIRECKTKIT